jgi:L,D-peptidoglycan transpeptidase YkuD (ErfK/YbiS/YcfS/YnhG family)
LPGLFLPAPPLTDRKMVMSHRLIVHAPSAQLFWPGGATGCALGRSGVCAAADKREGDGKTPLGLYVLRQVYVRADRVTGLVTGLPVSELDPDSGWCDDPADARYNRFVRHPFAAGAERLWREDGLYDIIVTLGHNDSPVVAGLGSAIFLHCCKFDEQGDMKPTLGCVAVPGAALQHLLRDATPQSLIAIY